MIIVNLMQLKKVLFKRKVYTNFKMVRLAGFEPASQE